MGLGLRSSHLRAGWFFDGMRYKLSGFYQFIYVHSLKSTQIWIKSRCHKFNKMSTRKGQYKCVWKNSRLRIHGTSMLAFQLTRQRRRTPNTFWNVQIEKCFTSFSLKCFILFQVIMETLTNIAMLIQPSHWQHYFIEVTSTDVVKMLIISKQVNKLYVKHINRRVNQDKSGVLSKLFMSWFDEQFVPPPPFIAIWLNKQSTNLVFLYLSTATDIFISTILPSTQIKLQFSYLWTVSVWSLNLLTTIK